jgi:predicted O-methyltransferase YrrM
LTTPRRVVESGVYDGLASAYILQALHDNGRGELISIDVNEEKLYPQDLSNAQPGWLVPEYLHDRWELHFADSREFLEENIEMNTIDVFLNDTPDDITYHNCRMATAAMRPGSTVMIAHPKSLLFGDIEGIDVPYRYAFLDKGAGTLNAGVLQEG